jgi:hypothetical protein
MTVWVVAALSAAVSLAALYVVARRFFRRKSALKRNPVVRELLDHAVAQRSVMRVEFVLSDGGGMFFSGPCGSVGSRLLRVDACLKSPLPERLGAVVEVTFALTNRGARSHYRFMSRVRGMPRRRGGVALLLECPEEITHNQKRGFVRLAPPKETIFGVGIWPLAAGAPRPPEPAALGNAAFSYRQDKEGRLSLANISAGGLNVKVSEAGEDASDIRPCPRLLCLLLLRALEKGQLLPIWLDCSVVRSESGESAVSLGLRFDAWAVPNRGRDGVEWFPVGGDGAVGPLASWVLRRQMTFSA